MIQGIVLQQQQGANILPAYLFPSQKQHCWEVTYPSHKIHTLRLFWCFSIFCISKINNGHRGKKTATVQTVKVLKMTLSKQPSDFHLLTTSHTQLYRKHTLESVHTLKSVHKWLSPNSPANVQLSSQKLFSASHNSLFLQT